MNNIKQNMVIAKEAGWILKESIKPATPFRTEKKVFVWFAPEYWYKTPAGQAYLDDRDSPILCPPSYVTDLNAMRGAELTKWHDEEFIEEYEEQLKETYIKHVGYSGAACWFMAPAHIRAEAFLKALKLWEN